MPLFLCGRGADTGMTVLLGGRQTHTVCEELPAADIKELHFLEARAYLTRYVQGH